MSERGTIKVDVALRSGGSVSLTVLVGDDMSSEDVAFLAALSDEISAYLHRSST